MSEVFGIPVEKREYCFLKVPAGPVMDQFIVDGIVPRGKSLDEQFAMFLWNLVDERLGEYVSGYGILFAIEAVNLMNGRARDLVRQMLARLRNGGILDVRAIQEED